MRAALLLIATILPLLSSVTYIRGILWGSVRPQRMTRFLLLAITGLSTAALFVAGDTSGIWLALGSFIQALVIWILALGRGMGGATWLDRCCLVLCCVGLAWWLLSGQSYVGLIASIAADFVAVVPALLKTIRLPHTESSLFYALDGLAAALVLSVGPHSWQAVLFPLYLLGINALFTGVVMWPRRTSNSAQ